MMKANPAPDSTARGPQGPAFKPLRPAARIVLVVLGTLALGLGIVGAVLPILPTTPFLLIAAGCYVRSSERLYNWLVEHERFGPAVRRYIRHKAIPLRVKIVSLAIAWAVLGGTALFLVDSLWVKALLIAVLLAKTAFMVRVPTLRQERRTPDHGS